eukprot:GEMP01053606.1.p1 GENE.GEMP01053606.1~~GEMP01053606.1.p1  ORF type:complete len:239 (-),score=50.59 GEMP01053606.1:158-874(-)
MLSSAARCPPPCPSKKRSEWHFGPTPWVNEEPFCAQIQRGGCGARGGGGDEMKRYGGKMDASGAVGPTECRLLGRSRDGKTRDLGINIVLHCLPLFRHRHHASITRQHRARVAKLQRSHHTIQERTIVSFSSKAPHSGPSTKLASSRTSIPPSCWPSHKATTGAKNFAVTNCSARWIFAHMDHAQSSMSSIAPPGQASSRQTTCKSLPSPNRRRLTNASSARNNGMSQPAARALASNA